MKSNKCFKTTKKHIYSPLEDFHPCCFSTFFFPLFFPSPKLNVHHKVKIAEKPEKLESYRYGKFFRELQLETRGQSERRPAVKKIHWSTDTPFLPSYRLHQDPPPVFKPRPGPLYRGYSSNKTRVDLNTLHQNKFTSSSTYLPSPSSQPFFSPVRTYSSSHPFPAPHQDVVRNTTKLPPTGSSDVYTSIDSYGKPLSKVITSTDSFGDSYGLPIGKIIKDPAGNAPGGGSPEEDTALPPPLSTNTVTLNNLNQQDTYGTPRAPILATTEDPRRQFPVIGRIEKDKIQSPIRGSSAEAGLQSIRGKTEEARHQNPIIEMTEENRNQSNQSPTFSPPMENLVAVFPQLQKDKKGLTIDNISKFNYNHNLQSEGTGGDLGSRPPSDAENSFPIILDNVENFNKTIEVIQEDNIDHDIINDGAENVNKEVGDKLEIVEQVALLGLPEVVRTINREEKELEMRKLSENKLNHVDSEKEVPRHMTESLSVEAGQQIERILVRNLTEVRGSGDETDNITDDETDDITDGMQEESRSRSEKRLRLPNIKIENARIQILAKPESGGNSKDDIVFIIYLNESDVEDEENKNAREDIEDLVFKD